MFRSIIHFELVSMKSVNSVSRFAVFFVFFACGWTVGSSTICRKNYLCSIVLLYLCCSAKGQLIVFMWVYFWACYSVPVIDFFFHQHHPSWLLQLNSALKLGRDNPTTLFFSFNTVWAMLGLLPPHVNFRTSLPFLI